MKKYFCLLVASVFGLAMLGCEDRTVSKETKTKYEDGKSTTESKEKKVRYDDGSKTTTEFKEKTEQYE